MLDEDERASGPEHAPGLAERLALVVDAAEHERRDHRVEAAVTCCDCNRDTLAAIESEGFEVAELERTELPKAPPFLRPLIVGTAHVRG